MPFSLDHDIIACTRCPRLQAWREKVAVEKRASFQGETYWGKPVPAFGPPEAQCLILGLAPAAHGANRTGRMFTGDRSGLWLYRALYKAGLSNQAQSEHANDGLKLFNVRITAAVHCAPPQNKPLTHERDNCFHWLVQEWQALPNCHTIVALGQLAWDAALKLLKQAGHAPPSPKPRFGHLVRHQSGEVMVIGSYHPSQQNTFTGRLTEPMFDAVFNAVKTRLLE